MTSLNAAANYWCIDGIFNTPSVTMNALVNSFVREARRLCSGNKVGPDDAPISVLFGLRRPSAIVGRVASFVVYPVNACLVWCRPHVGKKGGEVSPSLAHIYSRAAISNKRRLIAVFASLMHGIPNPIGSGSRKAMRLVYWGLTTKAPAACRVATCQVPGSNNGFAPAFANAKPSNYGAAALSARAICALLGGQLPKFSSGEVVRTCHNQLYVGVKYDVA